MIKSGEGRFLVRKQRFLAFSACPPEEEGAGLSLGSFIPTDIHPAHTGSVLSLCCLPKAHILLASQWGEDCNTYISGGTQKSKTQRSAVRANENTVPLNEALL